ncbi:hypothetical protein WA026_006842 [Henosepilachna vigintioctopunctata]|uniref:Peroxisome biogenesis factor 2 n=1 Tax=Henosepilachna vigintioctopunctata TaxID=420089 RepID=A0AAW1UK58_9CUCU
MALLRVTQLNAFYLDRQILNVFQDILHNTINNLPPGFITSYELEYNLLIELAVLYYSVVKNGSTFGQQLMSIKYENITDVKKVLYMALHSLGYIKSKIEYLKPSHPLNYGFNKIYMALKLLDLVNFTLFLYRGKKPQLIDRVLELNQVYNEGGTSRTYNSMYLGRELIWNSLIEIMVNVVPLMNFHKLKRLVRSINPFYHRREIVKLTKPCMTIHSKCALCGKSPILPHHMGCTHIFCYFCLRANLEADSKFSCPECHHWNENILCERVHVNY